MTNYLRVDAVNRQLVMDKTFAKNAQIVGSAEYDMLQRARSDYATHGSFASRIASRLLSISASAAAKASRRASSMPAKTC